jgi:DNA-binding transcriptional MerR regulator
MSEKTYSISELAREFDITTRTIRFYEEKGLLKPQRVGQQRLYRNADRIRLTLILRGKRIGLSLHESQDIIDMYDPSHGNVDQLQKLQHKVRERRQLLQAQLLDLQEMLNELDDVQQRCERALKSERKKEANP